MNGRALFRFGGGVRLETHKTGIQDLPSRRLPLPERLVLPLRQHVGRSARPVVTPGEHVGRGQLVAEADGYIGMRLHAPTSGEITAIGEFPVIHPGGLRSPAIELVPDGEDHGMAFADDNDPGTLTNEEIFRRIADAGIVGLGGAGFPSHVKVREGATQPVETLIVNAVECEPYICCDDRVAREQAASVMAGAALLARAMDARECLVAVEDDMPEAYAALAGACVEPVEVVAVPAVYPAGGEKQLITVLTGREVPSGSLPMHVGAAVLNVQTVLAIEQAVRTGAPLLERMITVTGDIEQAGNFKVLIGTPVEHLLRHTGALPLEGRTVVSGGPMMGTVVVDTGAPVTKAVNCILVRKSAPKPAPARACIRCGDCIPVCPVGLNPQQLLETVLTADFDSAQDLHLFDCIDCGCCAYVCPSRIPLVAHYRYAKSAIEALDRDRLAADRAREHHDRRTRRLAAAGHGSADVVELADLTVLDDDAIKRDLEAALARARRKRDPADDSSS